MILICYQLNTCFVVGMIGSPDLPIPHLVSPVTRHLHLQGSWPQLQCNLQMQGPNTSHLKRMDGSSKWEQLLFCEQKKGGYGRKTLKTSHGSGQLGRNEDWQ